MAEWAAEQVVDAGWARRLIALQFPELETASIPLAGEGWDNTVWLVDGAWVFRFPRRAAAVPAVERQIVALPRLAPLLPLPIPTPVYRGRPADGFPWPFYGTPFIPGREVADAALDDAQRIRLAEPSQPSPGGLADTGLPEHDEDAAFTEAGGAEETVDPCLLFRTPDKHSCILTGSRAWS